MKSICLPCLVLATWIIIAIFVSNTSSMDILDFKYEAKDALAFMQSLPDCSVQLVITSPPYNIGKEYETRTSLQNYLKEMEPIIREIYRILTPTGSVCWEVGNWVSEKEPKEVYPLDIYYYELFKNNQFILRNRIIWHFEHGLQCKNRFSGRYETILWFTKSDKYTFNLDNVRVPSKYPGKKSFKGVNKGKLSGNPNGKNPSDLWEATRKRLIEDWEAEIWDIPNVKSNHPEKTIHPCQFPIELVERCVLALTDEKDIVYDPFAGVGSTLIAALKNGRSAYGTELVDEYVRNGLQRIELLRNEVLKTRPIYETIYTPTGKDSVSKYPVEWLKLRLKGIKERQENMKAEKTIIEKLIAEREA